MQMQMQGFAVEGGVEEAGHVPAIAGVILE
jgi:hypothetical protein